MGMGVTGRTVIDSIVVRVPDVFADAIHEHRDKSELMALLSEAAEQAVNAQLPPIPRTITVQEWTVTCSWETAEAMPLAHDCDECREGRAFAVQWLKENPGKHLALGRLVYVQ